MNVKAYLDFDGRCEEALEFYKQKLGAKVTCLMRFKESPEPGYNPPEAAEKVMHSSFTLGETELYASDCMCTNQTKFNGISLTIELPNAAEVERVFSALSEGGQVQMPLSPTFFAESFGVVADKFGVSWTVIAGK